MPEAPGALRHRSLRPDPPNHLVFHLPAAELEIVPPRQFPGTALKRTRRSAMTRNSAAIDSRSASLATKESICDSATLAIARDSVSIRGAVSVKPSASRSRLQAVRGTCNRDLQLEIAGSGTLRRLDE